MSVMTYTNAVNKPFFLQGKPHVRELETIAQDAGRVAALAPFTLMAKDSSGYWTPLQDTDSPVSSAFLTGGALVGNLAAWQAVSDGEFDVTIDGEAISVTGLDFSGISALTEIANVINSHASVTGKFRVVDVDGVAGSFRIESLKQGLGVSSVSYLTVTGGAGTDIAGATTTGLNGLTGTGVITAATGDVYEEVPSGIFIGSSITAAAIAAGNVTNQPILVLGSHGLQIDKDQLVLENSVTVADMIKARGIFKTVEDYLADELGIVLKDGLDIDEYENS